MSVDLLNLSCQGVADMDRSQLLPLHKALSATSTRSHNLQKIFKESSIYENMDKLLVKDHILHGTFWYKNLQFELLIHFIG